MPIICFVPNSIGVQEFPTSCNVTETQAEGHDLLSIEEITIASGKIALPEADVVVSAGRGLKGPEHWGDDRRVGRRIRCRNSLFKTSQ